MKKQKGVNPLIATILLLLVCMAIAGVIWGWLQGFTQTQRTASEEQEKIFAGCSGSSFTIDLTDVEPDYNTASDQVRLVLLNKGDRDLNYFNITSFYSDGTSDANNNAQMNLQRGGSAVAYTKTGKGSMPERVVIESVDCTGIKAEVTKTEFGTVS